MKIAKKLVFLILACLLMLCPICIATSEPVATNDPVVTSAGGNQASSSVNIKNTDLYIAQQDVVIEEAINGNVFVIGSNVTIKSEIVGDLFVLANNLTIEETATIYSNVFAFADTFVMKGTAYDVYGFAKNFELASSGYIYRDIRLYSETANLSGVIKKDAYLIVSTIAMPEDAKNLIGGNLHYTSNQEASIPDGAVIGEVNYTKQEARTPTIAETISSYITSFITTILYAIAVILLATFFAPKFIEKSNYALMKKSFASAGIGILAFVLIPVIAIVLLMTGFLSYISMAILAVYVLVLSITLAIFSMAIAKSIEKKIKNPSKGKFILFSILSAIVLWLLQIVPFIGGYMTLFIFVVGLGVFLFSFFMRKDVSDLGKVKEGNVK